jgi:uncharacterized RDD family membrane protein YckC
MTIPPDSAPAPFALPDAVPPALLAPLAPRLLAALVDVILCGIVLLPFAIVVMGGVGFLFHHVQMSDDVANMKLTLGVWLVHPLVNGYLLATRGQTVGKWCFGMRIVRSDGSRASLRRLLLLRWLPTCLVAWLPGIGEWMWLVDPLFVFGRSRQCLHDFVADTVVVRTRPVRTQS